VTGMAFIDAGGAMTSSLLAVRDDLRVADGNDYLAGAAGTTSSVPAAGNDVLWAAPARLLSAGWAIHSCSN